MLRMFARRRSQIYVAPGEDQVLFGISLPSGSRINNVSANVHVVSNAIMPRTQVGMFAIEGYILPVIDPDAGADLETIWDTLVPKDDDVDTIDLDTGAADTQPFFEPGESSMAEVLDVGFQPEKVYSTRRMMSFANAGMRQEDASILEFAPAAVINIRVRKNYAIRNPSVLVFSLASPDLLDTTTVLEKAAEQNEWPRLKYMEVVLEQALMKFMGLVEAGAETPWEEAATLLRKHLEPDVYEENAGSWFGQSWYCFTDAVIDHSVEGTMGKLQLGTGG